MRRKINDRIQSLVDHDNYLSELIMRAFDKIDAICEYFEIEFEKSPQYKIVKKDKKEK